MPATRTKVCVSRSTSNASLERHEPLRDPRGQGSAQGLSDRVRCLALTSAQSIETQAATVKKMLDIKDLQDPKKVEKIIQKFTAKYDITNAGGTGSTDPVALLWQNMTSGSPCRSARTSTTASST